MKSCRVCNKIKPLDNFDVSKKHVDGKDSRCKECRKAAYFSNREAILAKAKLEYSTNPEKFRARKAVRYANVKDTMNSKRREKRKVDPSIKLAENKRRHGVRNDCFASLGSKCSCGVSDHDVLCVDHVLDDGQEERALGISPVTIWRKILRGEELDRYQLLCYNCNLRKSIMRDRTGCDTGVVKTCCICKQSLDTSLFKFDVKYNDGLYYECRKCTRKRVIVLKTNAILKVGEVVCGSCGSCDILSLTFDHVNNDGFSNRKLDGLGETLYRKIINGYVDVNKFQILCLNCNIKKHKDLIGARKSIAGFSNSGIKCEKEKTCVKVEVNEKRVYEQQEFSFDEAVVSEVDDTLKVVEFLKQHHYAEYGRYGSFHIICTIRGVIAAVAKFASPIRQNVIKSTGFDYSETLELDRFCIHPSFRKKNFASFFLSASSKKIKLMAPTIKCLVSFADPEQGHTGSIYIAAGWKEHHGRYNFGYRYEDESGKHFHKKTIWDQAKVRGISEYEHASMLGLRKISTPAKRKFILQLVKNSVKVH